MFLTAYAALFVCSLCITNIFLPDLTNALCAHAVNGNSCDLAATLAQNGDHSDRGHNDARCLPNKMCFWDCLTQKAPTPSPTTTPGARRL